MNRARVFITAGAAFLSAALAVMLLSDNRHNESSRSSQSLRPSQVLTWDCEYPVYKPELITITCADGGIYLQKIRWQTWSESGAEGTGIFTENLCEPSCAEGKRVEAEVRISLRDLTRFGKKHYLRALGVTAIDSKDFPWGRANGIELDVMEFAEMKESIKRG